MAVVHCLTAERTTGNKFLLEHTTSLKSQLSNTQNRTGLPLSPGLQPPDKGHLPSTAAIYSCAEKFFTQIQCSLWVYPEDQFYSRIEQTYSEESLKPTWFCFLYAFLSLTSPSEISDSGDYPLTSEEYYNLSTSYLPLVLYHPDLDGVRGLLTLVRTDLITRSSFAHLQAVHVSSTPSDFDAGISADRTCSETCPKPWAPPGQNICFSG